MAGHTALDAAFVAACERGDDAQAALLEQALEELARAPRPGIGAPGAAVWYARRGLRVFPLLPGEKRPLPGSRGVTDATDDPDRAAWLFRGWAGAGAAPLNLGVATGGRLDVVDVDGPEGHAAFARLARRRPGWLPVVRGVSQTPYGLHFWIPADPAAKNGARGHTGVDYRGRGGYAVAPPSQVGGTAYRWLLPPVL